MLEYTSIRTKDIILKKLFFILFFLFFHFNLCHLFWGRSTPNSFTVPLWRPTLHAFTAKSRTYGYRSVIYEVIYFIRFNILFYYFISIFLGILIVLNEFDNHKPWLISSFIELLGKGMKTPFIPKIWQQKKLFVGPPNYFYYKMLIFVLNYYMKVVLIFFDYSLKYLHNVLICINRISIK